MAIALYDPISSGHRDAFRLAYCEDLEHLGEEVITFGPESAKRMFDHCDTDYVSVAAPKKTRSRMGPLRPSVDVLRALYEAAKTIGRRPNIEFVFFSILDDYCDALISQRVARTVLGYPFSGILFLGDPFRFGGRQNQKTLNGGCPFGILDEGIVTKASASLSTRVVAFPDFATLSPDESPFADEVRRWAGKRTLISLCGFLGGHKGMPELIELAKRRDDIAVFIGGTLPSGQSVDELDLGDNVRLFPHRMEDADFDGIIKHSDVVWRGYKNFASSSNVFRKATLAHKPVIARRGALLAERVERFDLGWVFNTIDELVSVDFSQTGTADYAGFDREHSRARNRESLRSLLDFVRHE